MKVIDVAAGFRGRPLARAVYYLCMKLEELVDYRSSLPAHTAAYRFWCRQVDNLLKVSLWLWNRSI